MQKQLTARVQKLVKKLPQSATQFATAVAIDPDEPEVLQRKGSLYTVFDVSSESTLDPLLVTKIVHDVLFDSYYGAETVSPIQSLEKSILALKDKVMALGVSDFNILSAVLWGNVMYLVQFGKGGSFLVREGEVKSVNVATEGNFSVASGVIKGDDVVILGTQGFIDSHQVEDLVLKAVSFSTHTLTDKSSALLIKFDVLKAFTSDEVIDFGMEKGKKEVKDVKSRSTLDLARRLPSKLPKITLQKTKGDKVKPSLVVGIAIILLLGVSIYWSLNDNSFVPSQKEQGEELVEKQDGEIVAEEDTSKDEEYKITRVEPEVFYDIKIVEESANPTDMAVLDNSVVVSDKASGKIYSSSLVTAKFTAEDLVFEGITNLSYFGGDMVFTDNEGYKVYAPEGEITESYLASNLGPTAAYLSFVYSISSDTLTKYEKSTDKLEGDVWAQSEELQGVTSVAVDGNIYVLKENGNLHKYYGGEKEDYEITGLDKPFNNPTKVVKSIDIDYIYVCDKGNSRIVVLDEDGGLVAQYVAKEDVWSDIKSVSVSQDEETLYVLAGSKVYKLEL